MIYVVYFADGGTPKTGLSPTLDIFVKVSDGSSAGTPPAVSELSGGFYKFTYAATEEVAIRVDSEDATMNDSDRYVPLVAGPHDDDLDVAVSTRSSHTVANVRTEMEGAGTKLTDVKAQTDKLQFAAGNDIKATLDGEKVALSDVTETQIDAIETDTNEMQGKLPTNNIMGSSVKTDKDDEIDAIKTHVETNLDQKLSDTESYIRGEDLDDLKSLSDEIADLITRVKGLDDIHDDLTLKALEATLTAMKGAAFDGATDSLEAIRNRGDIAWLTATGFSVPNEYDAVIAAIQADLDNPTQYKATGFSTHTPADIWLAANRALSTPADYKADTSALALESGGRIQNIESDTNEIQSKLPDDKIAGSSDATSLESKHGSGSWEGVSGADWNPEERKQIRGALGVDGTKKEALDGDIQAIINHLVSIKGAGWTDETLKAIKEYVDELESGEKPPRKKSFDL